MDIRKLSALEIGALIKDKKISSPEVTKIYLNAIKAEDKEINSYITVFEEGAMKEASAVQKLVDKGEVLSPLMGVPVAIKDNICIRNTRTTSASKMLENFVPPYDATVIEKLKTAGAVVLGKTNMDEFAMGGSTETSYFGPTKNPWDIERVPGGSSGGSAAALAAELTPYALGTDTGGSIRQPCAFCNLTGIKPTYGSVSRFGAMAYGSSFDQIGTMGRSAKDVAASLSIISGYDEKDSTSVMKEPFDFSSIVNDKNTEDSLKGTKIGVPINMLREGLSDSVKSAILSATKEMQNAGAEIHEFEFPIVDYVVPTYYIIGCAEASSNLSRFDGVKFGFRSENADDILDIYYKSRSEGFGTEVKRRIMLGAFVLSSGYFDAYYKKALQVRGMIKKEFDEVLSKFDLILSPVSSTVPYKIGEQINDPLKMYMADLYTSAVNLTGLPAMALPCGTGKGGLPVGMQLVGRAFEESRLLAAADCYQKQTDHHLRRPDIVTDKKRGDQ